MRLAILLCAAITTAVGDTTGTDTTSDVAKREVPEFYPDWVPFKNKHGDELGEFVDVIKPKAKVKKRLALPMNFLVRAISDDSGDYMGQGESDSEDYYDKKDWSDLNRPVYNISEPISKENISDIDGVINIITQKSPNLAEEIQKSIPKQSYVNKDDYEDDIHNEKANTTKQSHVNKDDYEDEIHSEKANTTKQSHVNKDDYEDEIHSEKANITESSEDLTTTMEPEIKFALTPKTKIALFNEYDDDSEPSEPTTTQSPQESEAERKENEEKKKIILDSVDQLKYRHEQEARAISEKNKQDEYDNELHHKSIKIKKNRGSYNSKRHRDKPSPPNYDEYEDMSWKDKYSINVEKKTTSQEQDTEETTPEVTTVTPKSVYSDRGKYSVFRNPSLYVIDGDDDNESSQHKYPSNTPRRFSSKYSSAPSNAVNSAENYLFPPPVATTTEKVEPILYFPKMKPKRKQRKPKTTTATPVTAPDSYVAETVDDRLTDKRTTQPMSYQDTTVPETTEDYKNTAFETDYPTSTASLWKDDNADVNTGKFKKSLDIRDRETTKYDDPTTHHEDLPTERDSLTGPSGEAETSNTETVTDAVPASSDHKKEEPKDYHAEKGGGHEHHSSHEEEHEEHGKKAYEGLHKNTKTKKGYHDKEDHLGKYEDHGGHDKKHHDESGHYGAHLHEEHGKKHAKYEESGKHSKGHSTKGSHDIHKKEEYEKNVEFFEEEGDSGEEEKHGGFHNEKQHKAGGLFKKGNHENDHHEKKKGESGHFVKGGHHDVNKGHKLSGGHESHGKHGHANQAAGGHQSGKKWVYHHGYPAKNANLVIIDRRTDRYMHGPNYYG